MKYAAVADTRVLAWKGGRAVCPACDRPVVAKCGNVVVWHWSHAPRRHCDPWWETETEWHRAWKGHFPASWQEFVHIDPASGERHIADVRTDRGTVLEFQHSNIAVEEVAAREHFYGDMVWLLDAVRFSERLVIANRLPPPGSELASQLTLFLPPSPMPGRPGYWRYADIVFEKDIVVQRSPDGITTRMVAGPVFRVGVGRVKPAVEVAIDAAYQGHHLLVWQRAPEAWKRALKPMYLDLGGPDLLKVERWTDGESFCCQTVSKESFIQSLGGR